MRRRGENGQAIMLVVVACGLVLIGALGLAIDTSQLYFHQRLAQSAADAAAQAGIMTLFDHTGGSVTAHTCTAADADIACVYASKNGFTAPGDTIVLATNVPAPGVNLSTDPTDPITTLQVTITRPVKTGLIRMLGAASTMNIKAMAVAAIIQSNNPIPIIVTHPTLNASFSMKGGGSTIGITICGGPSRSIEVNSSSATSVSADNHATVDLSKAGPLDSGTCTTGTGADFGDFGGPNPFPNGTLLLGTKPGVYIQPASPIKDPLSTVSPPAKPAAAPGPVVGTLANSWGTGHGCTGTNTNPCNVYSPGLYTDGLEIKNEQAVFKPGVYWMDDTGPKQYGFQGAANSTMMMCNDCGTSADTGNDGMLVYIHHNGTFQVGSNGSATLKGSDPSSSYKAILFFEDRNAPANTGSGGHTLGGGGALSLQGTIYISNCLSGDTGCTNPMSSTVYQNLRLRGNPGSSTLIQGEIITSTLDIGGSGSIQMNLDAAATIVTRQVALVK
jgi:hypothetical protein